MKEELQRLKNLPLDLIETILPTLNWKDGLVLLILAASRMDYYTMAYEHWSVFYWRNPPSKVGSIVAYTEGKIAEEDLAYIYELLTQLLPYQIHISHGLDSIAIELYPEGSSPTI